MTSAQRKASPTSSAAATRHSASASLGSQSRAAIVAASDQRACILDVFAVAFAVAFDRAASGFAPSARARRVVAAMRGGTGCAGRDKQHQVSERFGRRAMNAVQSYFFFETNAKIAETDFRFLSFNSPSRNASPGPFRRSRRRVNRRQQVCLSLSFALSEEGPRPVKGPREKRNEKLQRNQFTPLTSLLFLSSNPKSRPSRASRHDGPKKETLRDGLNSVRERFGKRGR